MEGLQVRSFAKTIYQKNRGFYHSNAHVTPGLLLYTVMSTHDLIIMEHMAVWDAITNGRSSLFEKHQLSTMLQYSIWATGALPYLFHS